MWLHVRLKKPSSHARQTEPVSQQGKHPGGPDAPMLLPG
jgi:hypothetical protein